MSCANRESWLLSDVVLEELVEEVAEELRLFVLVLLVAADDESFSALLKIASNELLVNVLICMATLPAFLVPRDKQPKLLKNSSAGVPPVSIF